MGEETGFEVTLPGVLTVVLDDTDALDEVRVSPGRGGSLRLSGSAEALAAVHDRLQVFAAGGSSDTTAAERSAYRRWVTGLQKAGIEI